MRWLCGASIVLFVALPSFSEEPAASTPTTEPTPTTIEHGRPYAPRGVEGMPMSVPGFGMPGPKPKDAPAESDSPHPAP
jgi:hypothetical protein